MAFPVSPLNGATTIVNGITYTYSSATNAWTRTISSIINTAAFTQANSAYTQANAAYNKANSTTGLTYTANTNPPAMANKGDQWYDTTTDILYEYLTDGTSNVWLDITSSTISSNAVSGGGSSVANTKIYSYSGTTTNSIETEIFVNGTANNRMVLNSNTTILYNIDIVARRTDVQGTNAGYNIKGVISKNINTAADVGLIYEIVIARDNSFYNFDARANNGTLCLYANGVNAHSITWNAILTTVEVN